MSWQIQRGYLLTERMILDARRRVGSSAVLIKDYCFAARRATFITVVLDVLSLIFLKYLRSLFSSDVRYGMIMTFLSFVVCLLLLKLYDSSKRDWLGIEAVKRLRDYEGKKTVGRLWAWFLRKSEPVIFLFLSIKVDPLVTTIYLRRGNYNGMSQRDWAIFLGSLIMSNAYWTLACYMGITLFEWGWQKIIG